MVHLTQVSNVLDTFVFHMRSYSVAAFVLTIKPRQTNTQCYRVIQLRSVSIQQEGLKEEIFT